MRKLRNIDRFRQFCRRNKEVKRRRIVSAAKNAWHIECIRDSIVASKTNIPNPIVKKLSTERNFAGLENCDSTKNKSDKHKDVNIEAQQNVGNESEVTSTTTQCHENLHSRVPSPSMFVIDSRLEAKMCLEWLIYPFEISEFFETIWERKPFLLKRKDPGYFKNVFSVSYLDTILREMPVWFGKNIDVTSYVDGRRETHNPPGRAHASVVWDHYKEGCSVRFLNPQAFSLPIWKLNSNLQEVFGCFVGANVYLTPPGSQGFAPHYDDIEAFVLQLEGTKNWKLYAPRVPGDVLPRFSSEDLREDEIGTPILQMQLNPGNLLYFPRGTIHQASTPDDCHSLHITLSVYQRNTWGDLLEKLVPRALEVAIESDVEFRKGLPRDYARYMGIVNCDEEKAERNDFNSRVKQLMAKLFEYAPVDAAVDQMAKQFVHDALPPLLTKDEAARTVRGNSFDECIELRLDTKLKLLRSDVVRLVMEDDGIKLYHSADNSREYHGEEIQFVDLDARLAPAVEEFVQSYPEFTKIEDLPLPTDDDKLEICRILYDKGLVMTDDLGASRNVVVSSS